MTSTEIKANSGHLTPTLSPKGGEEDKLQRPFFEAFMPRYRGTVWENARRFRLIGKAYESMPPEQNGYFNIATCRHLTGPLTAWQHPDIRKILVRKAIQSQGSLVIDLVIPYIIEHDPRNTLLLFETDPKAMDYCSIRLMDTLKQHPVIGNMILDVQKVDRNNVTTTFIKFPAMTLLVGGLNDSNTASLAWPNVLISEAWFHKADGLLFKAFGRTAQFEHTCKILVESQAGMEGEDFARECDLAVRVPLTWACPHCGGRQEWEFSQKRAEEFKCRMQNAECRMQNEKPKPGTYAGMIIPHSTRMADGAEIEVSADERALGAEWECYWCGARLADTPPLRRQLMDSYQQIIPSPAPRAVVFDWPEEASLGISFAESVRHFLTADAAQKAGNIIPKQDWYMQRRARTWNPALTRPQIDIAPGSYDPNQIVPDEHSRNMAVDCQQDQVVMDKTGKSVTGWFWYIVRVVDKFGNSKQLARGYVKSWEEWIAVQKKWKVPNDRVVIDIGQWPGQITQRAADERETVAVNKMTMLGFMKDRTVTWYLLAAELMRRQFKHRDGQIRPWSPPQPIPATVFDNDGRRQVIHLKKIRWDNMTFRLQVDALRSGAPGMPKMEVLGREFLDAQTQAMERGDLTYERQMDAQYYIPEKRQFKELRPNDHYMACEAMLLVRQAMDGMMGHLAIAEDSSQESVVRS